MYEGYRHTERNAINAFVVDGRRIIKLAHYQYNAMAGSWRNLGTWVQRAKLVDDIGCPKMYAANLPDLGGTGAENAKLWGSTWSNQTQQKRFTRWHTCGCILSTPMLRTW